MRKQIASLQLLYNRDNWPIDQRAGDAPNHWRGWPGGKRFALVLTHDVETQKGHDRALRLLSIEEELGFRSSFNFVPRRYEVSPYVLEFIGSRGYEIGLHGLYHDGKYFNSRKLFQDRAVIMNQILKEWKSVGMRMPSMIHKLDWLHELNIEYDLSTFDTDPFEPQQEGVCTIFPFIVSSGNGSSGYVEMPYTLPQDFTLFIIMGQTSISIWKKKLDWIAQKGGMALICTHPDYMAFDGQKPGHEEYPGELYIDFLRYLNERYRDMYWNVLPKEMARFIRDWKLSRETDIK